MLTACKAVLRGTVAGRVSAPEILALPASCTYNQQSIYCQIRLCIVLRSFANSAFSACLLRHFLHLAESLISSESIPNLARPHVATTLNCGSNPPFVRCSKGIQPLLDCWEWKPSVALMRQTRTASQILCPAVMLQLRFQMQDSALRPATVTVSKVGAHPILLHSRSTRSPTCYEEGKVFCL